MDGWWKESIVMARDEEGSRSGILEIKSLDRPEAYAGEFQIRALDCL